MMQQTAMHALSKRRKNAGFTLTEMLVTTFILVVASTMMATGIPIAIDTYQTIVNSSNAQVALTSTLTVLRSEIGMSNDVRVVSGSDKVYYLTQEGYWASIGDSGTYDDSGGAGQWASDALGSFRGLEKTYYQGEPNPNTDKNAVTGIGDPLGGGTVPLISNSAITEPLKVHVEFDNATPSHTLKINRLVVQEVVLDAAGNQHINELASVENYSILLRLNS